MLHGLGFVLGLANLCNSIVTLVWKNDDSVNFTVIIFLASSIASEYSIHIVLNQTKVSYIMCKRRVTIYVRVCMPVYAYLYMCACTWVYVFVCFLWECVVMWVCVCRCLSLQMFVGILARVQIFSARVCLWMHLYMCALVDFFWLCLYTMIHSFISAYKYMYMLCSMRLSLKVFL